MPRRSKPLKRHIAPDARHGSYIIARLVNKIMLDGKKATAERIVYDALDIIKDKIGTDPVEVYDQALKNITPLVQVRARRVGGATYQVPVEVTPQRGMILAIRWMVDFARNRSGHSMAEKLAAEIMDASRGEGASIKKRTDMHKMAEANKAFAHYRW
jgi:small subunit ribosomal protein S7